MKKRYLLFLLFRAVLSLQKGNVRCFLAILIVVRDYFSGTPRLRQAVPAGEHTVELNVATLPPGIYHYSLEIGGRPVAHHNLLIQ